MDSVIVNNIHYTPLHVCIDLLAKAFYCWVQVRNLGAVMKDDNNRAISYHDKRLMKKVFNAWYFNQVRKTVRFSFGCRLLVYYMDESMGHICMWEIAVHNA